MKIIDPHIHLFSVSQGHYHWLKPENPPFWPEKASICRDVSEFELNTATLAGYVHIEAGFDNARPWREVNCLHSQCRLPMRIVGGVNLTSNDFHTQLDALTVKSQVVGVRDILDERAATLLRQPVVRHRLAELADRGLLFDAQLSLTDTNAVAQLEKVLEANPGLRIVINHCGFPPLLQEQHTLEMQLWKDALQRLSAYPGVSVKLSGWEMMSERPDWRSVSRIISAALRDFGAERIMMASNFPLLTFWMRYADYWQKVSELVPQMHRNALLHDNASRIYGF